MNVSNRYILNEGWNITINDKYYNNVELENFFIDPVVKNDVVVLEKVIPSDYEFEQAVLAVSTDISLSIIYNNYKKNNLIENQVVFLCR